MARRLKPRRGNLSQRQFDTLIEKYQQGLPLTGKENADLEYAFGFLDTGFFEGRHEYKEVLDNYLTKQEKLGQKKALEELRKDKSYQKLNRKQQVDFLKQVRETSTKELKRHRDQTQKTLGNLRGIAEEGRQDALRRESDYLRNLEDYEGRGRQQLQRQDQRYEDLLRRGRSAQSERRDLAFQSLGDFQRNQAETLSRWRSVYGREMADLNRIGDEQQMLMNEVMNAPSSVEQQARQNYDRQLQQAATMSAMGGRGVSQGQALRDMMQGGNARIMGETAAARGQEHLQRLGMRSNLLGAQQGLSQRRANLGLSDTDINRRQGLDSMMAYNNVQNQLNRNFEDEQRLYSYGRDQTQQNLNFESDILNQRRTAWGMSTDIMNRLRQEQYNIEEFGYQAAGREHGLNMDYLNMQRGALGDIIGVDQQNIQNQMAADRFNRVGDVVAFEESQKMIAEQDALNRLKADQERQRQAAMWATGLEWGGAALGGILGGPAGASLGGSLGRSFGGGSGQGADYSQLYTLGQNAFNNFRGSTPVNPNIMGRPVPTNIQPGGFGSTSIGGF